MKRLLLPIATLLVGCTEPVGSDSQTKSLAEPGNLTVASAVASPAEEQAPTPDQSPASAQEGACPSRPLPEYGTRMVGAEKTSIAYWPGFAAIAAVSPDGRESSFFCGGVLVNPDTVITAAHCLNDARQTADGKWWLNVKGADWQLGVLTNQDNIAADDSQTRAMVVGGATYREGANRYDRKTVANDIAYLKLSRPITGQPYARIAGAVAANPALDHHLLWAAGFGQLSNTPKETVVRTRSGGTATAESDVLRDAVLPLVPINECLKAYPGSIEDARQVCAGWSRGNRDTCYGDSGGPLVAIDNKGCPYVVGVTSFGSAKGCGVEGTYGVYTRLSRYREWIAKNAPGVQFAESPPVAMGAEATSNLLQIMIDQFAAKDHGVEIALVDRETLQPFPTENGRTMVPTGRSVIYRVNSEGSVSGQLLLIDRKQGRSAADGQLSKEYVLMYPNSYLSASANLSVAPNSPATIGGVGDPFQIVAGIDEPGAASQAGEVIALVLPSNIRLADLVAPPERTRSFALEPATDFPRAITQLEAANALLRGAGAQASDGQSGAGFGAATLPYEIRKP